MEMLPGWMVLLSIVAPLSLLILLFLAGVVNTRTFRTGSRFGLRYPAQTIARGIPISLLIAVIIGSLSVGDGLLMMVENNTDRNLSGVDMIINAPSFIPEDLIERDGIPIIDIQGTASIPGGKRLGSVKVLGISKDALNITPITVRDGNSGEDIPSRHETFVNGKMAEELDIGIDDRITVLVDPFRRSATNLLGHSSDTAVKMNLTVTCIIRNSGLGRYREDSLDRTPYIMVLDLRYLQERIDRTGEVNKVLIPRDSGTDSFALKEELDRSFDLETAGLEVLPGSEIEADIVQSSDLFFDGSLIVDDSYRGATLSYFVDSISTGPSGVPYSVVTGLDADGLRELNIIDDGFLPTTIGKGEIVLNNWTSEHLNVDTGDSVKITYRKIDDLGQDRMEYRMFEIVAIQDLKGPGLETGFMPSVPGLTDSPTCGSWDPGFDIDLDALDDNDTEYWESYRTAPKAYISIGDARELWSNPYGDTTAVLFPTNSTIEMDSGSLGISIIKVRENALGSSSALLIFPGMFLTFGSIMIIGALLILHAVIRDLGRSRSHEWGILRSMGMNRKGIYSSALGESAWSILTGIIIGIPLGYLLSLLLHAGLRSAWERSVESSSIPFHISIATLIFSVAVGSSVSLLLIMFSSWMETKQVVAVNLREKDASISSGTRRRLLFIGGAGTGAGLLIAIIGTGYGTSSAPTFFTISTILLSPGIAALIYSVISRTFRWGHTSLMVSANLSRRPGKHPLAVAILSMALALALSLTATGEIIQNGAEDRLDNYGGGFDLVVETTAPYAGDIELQGIDQAVFLSVGSEGGTCSNLNAVYPPRLLGAGEELLHGSNFDLAEQMDRTDGSTWEGLSGMRDDAYPILVDRNTLQWIYYRSLGDRFRLDDESGNAVELVVIGVLEPSILTGSFVMSWEHLRELFPSRAMATYILLGGEELEREWIEKEFSGYSPIVTSVEDLARENLESELSYLYLFRDLLVIGLVVSMTSAAIFTHVRALSLKKEIEVMRRIGATSRRTVNYFLLENLIIFLIAAAGSLTGSIITMVLFMDHLGSGGNLADVVLPTSVVIAAFLAVSILTALLSSIWAVGSSRRRNGPVQLE